MSVGGRYRFQVAFSVALSDVERECAVLLRHLIIVRR
jgi:hypothetical protein